MQDRAEYIVTYRDGNGTMHNKVVRVSDALEFSKEVSKQGGQIYMAVRK